MCPALDRVTMKHLIRNQVAGEVGERRSCESAQVRAIIFALVSFLMGLAVGALWLSRKAPAEISSQHEQANQNGQVDRTGLTNELARTTEVSPAPQPAPAVDPAALEAVQRAIPNVKSTTLESGTRILRKAAVAEFQQTVEDLRARQKQAEQDLIKGQNKLSDEQRKIAMKQLQELQAEQIEKLKQIAANSKAQIDTFQQLKGAAP